MQVLYSLLFIHLSKQLHIQQPFPLSLQIKFKCRQLWNEQKLASVPAGFFVGTGAQLGGQETTM